MKISDKALELIVRDVLDGMEELAIHEGLKSGANGLEIIAVEPADPATDDAPVTSARVLEFPLTKT